MARKRGASHQIASRDTNPDSARVLQLVVGEALEQFQQIGPDMRPDQYIALILGTLKAAEFRFDELTPDTVAFRKSAASHLLTLERLLYAIRLLLEAENFDIIAELKAAARRIVHSYERKRTLGEEDVVAVAVAVDREYKRLERKIRNSNDPKVALGIQILRGLEFTDLTQFMEKAGPQRENRGPRGRRRPHGKGNK